MLACAAVIGKDFGVDAVRELLPPEARGPLGRNLQTLIAKGLVERGPPGVKAVGEEYSFRHILIQEAATGRSPSRVAPNCIIAYADWLEYVFLDDRRSNARRSSATTSSSPSAISANCGPPRPSRVRCRAGRPYTSRMPVVPLMIATTRTRR